MLDHNKIVKIAEKLGWSSKAEAGDYSFQIFSPAGRDFYLEFSSPDVETLKKDLADFIDDYDVSYETSLWLDEWGHGKNGAPYDMEDIYLDSKWCVDATLELYRELFHY